jgi:hypothetical protein
MVSAAKLCPQPARVSSPAGSYVVIERIDVHYFQTQKPQRESHSRQRVAYPRDRRPLACTVPDRRQPCLHKSRFLTEVVPP